LEGDGQTPGYKSYDLKVVDFKTQKKASIFQILIRNIVLFLSVITLFPLLVMFFRKDRRGLHDILSGSVAIKINS